MVAMSLAALAVLVACGPAQTAQPTPSGVGNAVRSGRDLRCSLPVIVGTRVGFVDFPAGKFRQDPDAPNPAQHFGLAYSFGAKRWVPTGYAYGWQLLSPDGRYLVVGQRPPAYSGPVQSPVAGATEIDQIDVVTGAGTKIGSVPGSARVIAWGKDGIYLESFPGAPATGVVLRLDPATGRSVQLGPGTGPPGSYVWFWVTSAAVWASLFPGPNQSDQNPVLSLSHGSIRQWYVSPATRSVSILGFVTPSEPLVVEFNREPYDRMTGMAFMLLAAPNVTQSVKLDPAIIAWGVTDTFGVWLEAPGRVWLYDSAGLVKMADLSSSIGSAMPGVVGPCGDVAS